MQQEEKQRVLGKARSAAQPHKPANDDSADLVRPANRSLSVNTDDWARLIHLCADPRFRVAFSSAFQPLDRQQLDRRGCDRDDPWSGIADGFNDYQSVTYKNETRVDCGSRDRKRVV